MPIKSVSSIVCNWRIKSKTNQSLASTQINSYSLEVHFQSQNSPGINLTWNPTKHKWEKQQQKCSKDEQKMPIFSIFFLQRASPIIMEDLQAHEANIAQTREGRTADNSPPFQDLLCPQLFPEHAGWALETGAKSFARIPTSSCTSAQCKSTISYGWLAAFGLEPLALSKHKKHTTHSLQKGLSKTG